MPFHKIVRRPEFEKDLKKLSKRFRSLPGDLESFVQIQLKLFHNLGIDNGGIVRIPGLPFRSPPFARQDRVEFVELYFKGDQENEDKDRIVRLYQPREGA